VDPMVGSTLISSLTLDSQPNDSIRACWMLDNVDQKGC